MQIESIFPIPLLRVDNFINEAQCADILAHCKENAELTYHGCLPRNAMSTHHTHGDILQDISLSLDSLSAVHYNIASTLNEYAKECRLPPLRITESWVNFQDKDSVLIDHTHPNSKVSGVLYIQTDEYSSPLYFENPNPFVHFELYSMPDIYSGTTFRVEPTNGTLLLFPSWLRHGSRHEQSESDSRVAISLNSWEIE